MKRDYKLYLNDIQESISLIERYTAKVSEEEFIKSIDLQDKVIRRLEIVGEAISKIPRALKEKNPCELWEKISEFRNFVAHQYFEASLNRIWKVIKNDLPTLKKHIENIKLV